MPRISDFIPYLRNPCRSRSETMQNAGYAVNWDATFWWPYIMMIAPTITVPFNRTELWGSAFDQVTGFDNRLAQVHVQASHVIRDDYYAKWQEANHTVLGYFNGWELGESMTDYPRPKSCPPTADLWRSAPCFIHTYLDSALSRADRGGRREGTSNLGWGCWGRSSKAPCVWTVCPRLWCAARARAEG